MAVNGTDVAIPDDIDDMFDDALDDLKAASTQKATNSMDNPAKADNDGQGEEAIEQCLNELQPPPSDDVDEMAKEFQKFTAQCGGDGTAAATADALPEIDTSGFSDFSKSLMDTMVEMRGALKAPPKPAEEGPFSQQFFDDFMNAFKDISNDAEFGNFVDDLMKQTMTKSHVMDSFQAINKSTKAYLEKTSSIPEKDRTRYEAQIKLYDEMISMSENCKGDDFDDAEREKVRDLMADLAAHGQPPTEVLSGVGGDTTGVAPPKGGDESFESFLKTMGVNDASFGEEEKKMFEQMADDPVQAQKMMESLAGGSDECKNM